MNSKELKETIEILKGIKDSKDFKLINEAIRACMITSNLKQQQEANKNVR